MENACKLNETGPDTLRPKVTLKVINDRFSEELNYLKNSVLFSKTILEKFEDRLPIKEVPSPSVMDKSEVDPGWLTRLETNLVVLHFQLQELEKNLDSIMNKIE
jgi:hypothetical protein